MRYCLFIGIVWLTLTACGGKDTPRGILAPDKMQAVMWDVVRADVFTTDFIKKDSTKRDTVENVKLQQQIFLIHGTDKQEYYRSLEYYKKHPDLMRVMLDTMTVRVNRARNRTVSPNTTLPSTLDTNRQSRPLPMGEDTGKGKQGMQGQQSVIAQPAAEAPLQKPVIQKADTIGLRKRVLPNSKWKNKKMQRALPINPLPGNQ